MKNWEKSKIKKLKSWETDLNTKNLKKWNNKEKNQSWYLKSLKSEKNYKLERKNKKLIIWKTGKLIKNRTIKKIRNLKDN